MGEVGVHEEGVLVVEHVQVLGVFCHHLIVLLDEAVHNKVHIEKSKITHTDNVKNGLILKL